MMMRTAKLTAAELEIELARQVTRLYRVLRYMDRPHSPAGALLESVINDLRSLTPSEDRQA
jgi:hypothetical protein